MSHKELAARMREHARIHRDHVPQDDEQQQWADDLVCAAQLVQQRDELLEALIRLRQWAEADQINYTGDHPVAKARAAIAKSTGAQS